ncbi:hypothetical protein KC19_4G036700 [Ceratodon purpureus]|uniref:Remorin C-terminal domain-containing protein n=1 Tax=Ceratodon purpureus TaxID=3225 RepID=A0A8T0I864_CERPU|nr:hypothetical protein KC19_4G036700 [Ceratodon purpureus]
MSMRRATQCLGKLPEKPRSRGPSQPTSPLWPGYHTRWHDSEQETSKLIHAASPVASVTSERVYRSHETVKAWLDSSPTSVLDDQNDDESVPSSFESLSSSPLGSPRYRSHSTSRFFSSSSELNQPAHVRVRAISPPRCPANRDPADVSRIDAGRCSGGSFLMLAFKNTSNRRTSAPKTFQFSSGAFRDDHLQDFTPEECGSPGSEFSLTHEWHHMLEAGTAAGMSTRDSSGNDSDYENPYDALNGSEFGLGSVATSMSRSHAQVVRKPSRTRSMELPPKSRGHDGSGSGLLKDEKSQFMAHHITTLPRHSAPLMNRDQSQGVNYDMSDIQRISRRHSERTTSMRDAFEHVQNQKVHNNAAALEEGKCSKLASRYEREEREIKSWEEQQRAKATSAMKQAELKLELKRVRLIEKMQNDLAMARRKAEEKRAMAEAKRAEKAARTAMDAKFMRRISKVPRGCLFLS